VTEVHVKRMKGGSYLLKLDWSDGTSCEISQSFQGLKVTYDEVSCYCESWLIITPVPLKLRPYGAIQICLLLLLLLIRVCSYVGIVCIKHASNNLHVCYHWMYLQ